jgi:hypothetical protein
MWCTIRAWLGIPLKSVKANGGLRVPARIQSRLRRAALHARSRYDFYGGEDKAHTIASAFHRVRRRHDSVAHRRPDPF